MVAAGAALRSGADGLVLAVRGRFELEGGVLNTDREVLGHALVQAVEDLLGVAVAQAFVAHCHMCREHR